MSSEGSANRPNWGIFGSIGTPTLTIVDISMVDISARPPHLSRGERGPPGPGAACPRICPKDELLVVRELDPDRDLADAVDGHWVEREIDDRGTKEGCVHAEQAVAFRVWSTEHAEFPASRRGIEDQATLIREQHAPEALEEAVCVNDRFDVPGRCDEYAGPSAGEAGAERHRTGIVPDWELTEIAEDAPGPCDNDGWAPVSRVDPLATRCEVGSKGDPTPAIDDRETKERAEDLPCCGDRCDEAVAPREDARRLGLRSRSVCHGPVFIDRWSQWAGMVRHGADSTVADEDDRAPPGCEIGVVAGRPAIIDVRG